MVVKGEKQKDERMEIRAPTESAAAAIGVWNGWLSVACWWLLGQLKPAQLHLNCLCSMEKRDFVGAEDKPY